ncbi:MAG: hypothetical protein B7Z80_03290 [Rhodospirillales bacterium 20-64-7]|nr:MAG: hypothetical protein B7Z80_03290 [Rhodospirillales bacterium 20-64-7]
MDGGATRKLIVEILAIGSRGCVFDRLQRTSRAKTAFDCPRYSIDKADAMPFTWSHIMDVVVVGLFAVQVAPFTKDFADIVDARGVSRPTQVTNFYFVSDSVNGCPPSIIALLAIFDVAELYVMFKITRSVAGLFHRPTNS